MDIHIAKVRTQLKIRKAPYWRVIRRGCAVGVRRNSSGEDTWLGRYRLDGTKHFTRFGRTSALSWDQVLREANKWFDQCESGQRTTCVTVAEACRLYVDNRLLEKGEDTARGLVRRTSTKQ